MFFSLSIILVAYVAHSLGRPKYIAIPLEDIEFINLTPKTQALIHSSSTENHRLPALSDQPIIRQPRGHADKPAGTARINHADKPAGTARINHADNTEYSEPTSDESRAERQQGDHHHHHPHVDYGAHTGHHGAFGWYADFPVHKGS